MVAIMDSNPHLSSSSKGALLTAADLAKGAAGSAPALTVLFLDDSSAAVPNDAERVPRVQAALEGAGVPAASLRFVEDTVEHASGKGSAAVGEHAEQLGADLVVLSSAAVHEKHVDANLLAEFVDAPVLLLP